MTIDELKRLDPNEEILLVRTLKPIRAKKAWYFKYHPMKDVAKQYEIHDISEMPKTDDVPVKVMNVREHLQKREERAKKILEQRHTATAPEYTTPIKNNQVTNNNPESLFTSKQDGITGQQTKPVIQQNQNLQNDEFDLQKELEKKFDELFGDSNE